MALIPFFHYKPLAHRQEIRVIKLMRGLWDDPISCEIENVDFTRIYEAVSYEWGPRGIEECILLDGTPFMVRKNLHDALRHFRRSTWDRVLWVDALCINQKKKDNSEKNQQLPLMGKIYSQAWDTLVWLGPARDDSDIAISYLERIGQNKYEVGLEIIRGIQETNTRAMRAILALCNRSYWQRVWVVQEIRLASQITIFCGNVTISGESFMSAGKTIQNAYNPEFQHLLNQIGDSLASKIMDYSQSEDLRLKDWLVITRESKSSIPKDKVQALINLGTDSRGSWKLDYSANVSISQVYKEVLRHCSVGKYTSRPVFDVLDLSQVLQRALNTPSDSVQLTDEDNETIWICGVFSAEITSFQEDRRVAWSHELYPKNISEGDNSFGSTKSNACVLNANAGKSMEIIRKRRYSDPKAPVQIVKDIRITASLPMITSEMALVDLQTTLRVESRKLKGSRDRGKCFRCSGQDCSGFAPTDAKIGDKICRFPGSRIGLLYRQFVGREDKGWLVGRVITDKRFKISEEDVRNFWRGDPRDPANVSFGCDDAWYLKMNMVTLQRLTAD